MGRVRIYLRCVVSDAEIIPSNDVLLPDIFTTLSNFIY